MGWEDASRNTATFAVSREHRAGPGRSEQPNRTGTRERGEGREEGEPVTGPQGGPVVRAFGVGQPLPRKIMPGVDIVPTRAGLVIGLMVSLSGPPFLPEQEDPFLCPVQPPPQTFDQSKNG